VLKAKGFEDRHESIVPNKNRDLDLRLTEAKDASSSARPRKPRDHAKKPETSTTKAGDNLLKPKL
jgi:hypothetical protein